MTEERDWKTWALTRKPWQYWTAGILGAYLLIFCGKDIIEMNSSDAAPQTNTQAELEAEAQIRFHEEIVATVQTAVKQCRGGSKSADLALYRRVLERRDVKIAPEDRQFCESIRLTILDAVTEAIKELPPPPPSTGKTRPSIYKTKPEEPRDDYGKY